MPRTRSDKKKRILRVSKTKPIKKRIKKKLKVMKKQKPTKPLKKKILKKVALRRQAIKPSSDVVASKEEGFKSH